MYALSKLLAPTTRLDDHNRRSNEIQPTTNVEMDGLAKTEDP